MLQSTGSQRVVHGLAAKQQHQQMGKPHTHTHTHTHTHVHRLERVREPKGRKRCSLQSSGFWMAGHPCGLRLSRGFLAVALNPPPYKATLFQHDLTLITSARIHSPGPSARLSGDTVRFPRTRRLHPPGRGSPWWAATPGIMHTAGPDVDGQHGR